MNLTLDETADLLLQNDNFLLLTHIKPDGDTIGSACALCLALQKLGKTAFVCDNSEATPRLKIISERFIAPQNFKPDFIIAVDCSDRKRLPSEFSERNINLCIDHHISNNGFAEKTLLDVDAAAAGEIICALCERLNIPIDAQIGRLIYIAVATDTGCFRYSNTTSNTHFVAAKCFQSGADLYTVNKLFFETKTKARLAVEKFFYDKLSFFENGKLAVIVITQEDIARLSATQEDMEGISSLPLQVEGVKLALTITEGDDGVFKMSARSVKGINSSEFCSFFGGGGHFAAAGASLGKNFLNNKSLVINKALEFLRNV